MKTRRGYLDQISDESSLSFFYRRNLWEMISRHEEVQTGTTALRGWRMYGVGILNLFHGRHLTAFLIPLTIKNNANSAPPQRYNHFLIRVSFAPSPTAPPIWSQSPRVDSSSLLTVYIRILFGSILKVFELTCKLNLLILSSDLIERLLIFQKICLRSKLFR